MKQVHTFIFALVILVASLPAQGPQKVLIEELFSTRDPDRFFQVLESAKQAKIDTQALLEAQFLYYVDLQDYQSLAKLTPTLQQTKFSANNSEIFTLEEDWLAITKYCESLQALLTKDYSHFKKCITEAFWLSPRQAGAFAPHIEELKLSQAMEKLTLPPSLQLPNLLDDESTLLISKKHVATLLYFWSPWSREFDDTLEDFKLTNTEALKHDFNILSLLAESSVEVEADAKAYLTDHEISKLSKWVKDTDNQMLSRSLRIQNVPTLVLISNQGGILFNGHPSNPQFWEAISKISPNFKQPIFVE